MCLYYFDWAPLFCDSILILSSVLCPNLFASVNQKFEFQTTHEMSVWNVKFIRSHSFGHFFGLFHRWRFHVSCLFSLLTHFHSFLCSTNSNRNACGSTRMQRSGLPSSESCVPSPRAWKTCSTMGFSNQRAMGGTASSWTKNASCESTPSQSARASHLWR